MFTRSAVAPIARHVCASYAKCFRVIGEVGRLDGHGVFYILLEGVLGSRTTRRVAVDGQNPIPSGVVVPFKNNTRSIIQRLLRVR
jgi:hypothetical protein